MKCLYSLIKANPKLTCGLLSPAIIFILKTYGLYICSSFLQYFVHINASRFACVCKLPSWNSTDSILGLVCLWFISILPDKRAALRKIVNHIFSMNQRLDIWCVLNILCVGIFYLSFSHDSPISSLWHTGILVKIFMKNTSSGENHLRFRKFCDLLRQKAGLR